MRTRRSLIAAAAALAGWWQTGVHGPGGRAARADSACVEPDGGPMRDGCAQPPRMVLGVPTGGSQEAGLGSTCWATGGSGCCIDMIGPVYPTCPLVLPAGEVMEIQFQDLGVVSELSVELRPDPAVASGNARRPTRRRTGREALWRLVLDRPASPLRLPAFLPPGAYVIDLFAYADGPRGGGDTSQGFRIVVEPRADESPSGAATTPPVAGATPVGDASAE